MLTATLSYSKFEIIQLQREESAAKSNISGNMFFILEVHEGIETTITYRLLTICLLDKAHVTKMKLN